jgi:hypothetical protein
MKFLLDYFFPITTIEPTPEASTAYLKNVLAICKPKLGATEDTPTLCTSKTDVDAFTTDNAEIDELFDGGMSRVWVMASDDLEGVGTDIADYISEFFTILITSDFNDTEIDALAKGEFEGVIGAASTNDTKNATRAAIENYCAFHTDSTVKSKNMFYAFGKFLSQASGWRNQQYITLPYADDVDTLGEAETLFDDKISFVGNDSEFGKRLLLFAAGGKAIAAPYIKANIRIDMQSAALQYVSGNQPPYTAKHAALIEDELQKVIQGYIDDDEITAGTVEVELGDEAFTAEADINIAEPSALWRISGTMRSTL